MGISLPTILAEAVGLFGVLLVLLAYALLQLDKLGPHSRWYLGMNLAGALGILASLAVNWNLSAAAMEGAWALVSLYGLIKTFRTS